LIELFTAVSRALFAPPPRLMFAIAGCPAPWLPVTQSTPAMTPEVLPEPWQFRARTPTSRTPLATPWTEPPTVPATWVPCPLQSSAEPPSTESNPVTARPPNCVCENRIPVSMMDAVTPALVAL
jgi:hypothetical protein